MNTDSFIKDIFAVVDSRDAAGVAAMMTEDGIFRFANMPGIQGRQAITEFLGNFFQSIKAIRHDQLEDWMVDNTRFATGRVTYTRLDGSELTAPFSVLLRMRDKLIAEYLIFVDASELYARQ